jgi:hypothetical protein
LWHCFKKGVLFFKNKRCSLVEEGAGAFAFCIEIKKELIQK